MIKKIKAQQEAVGFVIIILMVMIIGVIFLGISLRKSSIVSTESAEIANFLGASLAYTTDCYKDSEPNYRSLADLAKDCFQGRALGITCPDARTACEVLNSTYQDMLSKFRPAGQIKYYSLKFIYNSTETQREYLEIKSGNFSGCGIRKAGREQINEETGKIIAELEACWAE